MASFVYKQHITSSLHLWVPNGNTAICYVQELARCLHLSSLLIYNSVSFSPLQCCYATTTVFFGLGCKVWGYTVIIPLLDHQPLARTHTQACIIMHEQTSRSLQNKQNAAWVNWVVIFSPITICLSHLVYLLFCFMLWSELMFFNEFTLWTDSISSKLIGQEWLVNAPALASSHYLPSFVTDRPTRLSCTLDKIMKELKIVRHLWIMAETWLLNSLWFQWTPKSWVTGTERVGVMLLKNISHTIQI